MVRFSDERLLAAESVSSIVALPDGGWAGASLDRLVVAGSSDEGFGVQARPARLLGAVVAIGSTEVLAGLERFDLVRRSWAERPDPGPALTPDPGGPGGYTADLAVALSPHAVLVSAGFRPGRSDAVPSDPVGPAHRVVVIDPDIPALVAVLAEGEVRPTALAAGDGWAAGACDDLTFWALAGDVLGAVLASVVVDAPISALAAVGPRLALGGTVGGDVLALRVAPDPVTARWAAHAGVVTTVAPVGAGLVSGGEDGVVRLWSAEGELRGEHDLGAAVEAVAGAPDGRLAVSARGPEPRVVELMIR